MEYKARSKGTILLDDLAVNTRIKPEEAMLLCNANSQSASSDMVS